MRMLRSALVLTAVLAACGPGGEPGDPDAATELEPETASEAEPEAIADTSPEPEPEPEAIGDAAAEPEVEVTTELVPVDASDAPDAELEIGPGQAPKPGSAPTYQPFPGGLPAYPAPLDYTPDGIHPNAEGFRTIIENTLDQGPAARIEGLPWP